MFKVYNLANFDICIYLLKHHYNRSSKHVITLVVSLCPFVISPFCPLHTLSFPPPPQEATDLLILSL